MTGFWRTYLLAVTDLLIVMGVAFAALAIVPGWYGALAWLNELAGGAVVAGEDSIRTVRFLYGIVGGILAGWGILLYFVIKNAAGSGTLRLVGASVAGWYVLDTTASVVTGFYVNVAINTFLLVALLIVPLVGTMRESRRVAPQN